MALTRPQNEHLFTAGELKRKARAWPGSASAGTTHSRHLRGCAALSRLKSEKDQRSAVRMDLGVTNKFWQVQNL